MGEDAQNAGVTTDYPTRDKPTNATNPKADEQNRPRYL
jgi:hypothetical protein